MSSLFASLKAALRPAAMPATAPPDGASQPAPAGAAQRWTSSDAVEELELELLLQAMLQRHGHDFRGYRRAVIMHKVHTLRAQLGLLTISALQSHILHDDKACDALLRALHVAPARMFDDALEVSMLRLSLGASLHGAALPRVWLADCAGAQQAWTLAILLDQEQLAARTEIYATVNNDATLADIRQASLPTAQLDELQLNYVRSGGNGKLLDYFHVSEDGQRATLRPQLASRITWAQYNLVTDASFNEFHMILGHRVLPDFDPALRMRVQQLFNDSLAPFGVLALDRELDAHDPLARNYQPILARQTWYKRVA